MRFCMHLAGLYSQACCCLTIVPGSQPSWPCQPEGSVGGRWSHNLQKIICSERTASGKWVRLPSRGAFMRQYISYISVQLEILFKIHHFYSILNADSRNTIGRGSSLWLALLLLIWLNPAVGNPGCFPSGAGEEIWKLESLQGQILCLLVSYCYIVNYPTN